MSYSISHNGTSHHNTLTMVVNPQKQSPFCRLPPELRAKIYGYCVPTGITIADATFPSTAKYMTSRCIRPPLAIGLQRTCRLINKEMDIASIYSDNTFSFTNPSICSTFITMVAPIFKNMITAILVDLSTIQDTTASGALSPATYSVAPDTITEWVHYLTCGGQTGAAACDQYPGTYLLTDLPHVESVTLDIRAAQRMSGRFCAYRRLLPFFAGTSGRRNEFGARWSRYPSMELQVRGFDRRTEEDRVLNFQHHSDEYRGDVSPLEYVAEVFGDGQPPLALP